MDDTLLERLLNEEESSSLDFKRDQYRFSGASDDQKAELLKDILAFANAWRREAAYILIGVDEVRGGRSVPVGVVDHLSDHELQQFVNSKANRPVTFRYIAYPYQGVQLGILEIPVQERPFYLGKRFSGLQENVVFVRRGSSTAIAAPDDIARMGAANITASPSASALFLEWGEPDSRRQLGPTAQISVEVLTPKLEPAAMPQPGAIMVGMGEPDADYPSKLIEFSFESRIMRALFLVIHNLGQVPAENATVSGTISKVEGMRLLDWPPQRPRRFGRDYSSMRFRSPVSRPEPEIDEHADQWTLTIPFGTIRPGQTMWSTEPLYIGADRPMRIDLPLKIMANNIPEPLVVSLAVDISVTTRPMAVKDTVEAEE